MSQIPAPKLPDDLAVIITAAGRGLRAGGGVAKQWRELAGRPVLAHTVDAFAGAARRIVVVAPDDLDRALELVQGRATLAIGGATRAASVKAGLELLEGSNIRHVLIHDGARPLVSPVVIAGVVDALRGGAVAAAPALPVTDALWRGAAGRVSETVSRDGLYRAQTPQGFELAPILAAHRTDDAESAADDVALALKSGLDVTITEGCEDNLKLTWPPDFARAERIWKERHGSASRERV